MNNFIIKSILLLFFFLNSHCGFKVLDETQLKNYTIKEVLVSGDNKINFKIKNNLLITSSKSENISLLIINLDTKKIKNIKERNIKNEITKYEISLNANIKIDIIESEKNLEFNIMVMGDFLVGSNYSTTLINEKKLIDNLTQDISNKIINNIRLKLNDI